jgi:hypothetical protein
MCSYCKCASLQTKLLHTRHSLSENCTTIHCSTSLPAFPERVISLLLFRLFPSISNSYARNRNNSHASILAVRPLRWSSSPSSRCHSRGRASAQSLHPQPRRPIFSLIQPFFFPSGSLPCLALALCSLHPLEMDRDVGKESHKINFLPDRWVLARC